MPSEIKYVRAATRAPFAQSQIVLRGSALVAVTFDRDDPRRILLQHRRVRLKHRAAASFTSELS